MTIIRYKNNNYFKIFQKNKKSAIPKEKSLGSFYNSQGFLAFSF